MPSRPVISAVDKNIKTKDEPRDKFLDSSYSEAGSTMNDRIQSAIELTNHIDQRLIPILIRVRGPVPENPNLTRSMGDIDIPLMDQLNYLLTRLDLIKEGMSELERLI